MRRYLPKLLCAGDIGFGDRFGEPVRRDRAMRTNRTFLAWRSKLPNTCIKLGQLNTAENPELSLRSPGGGWNRVPALLSLPGPQYSAEEQRDEQIISEVSPKTLWCEDPDQARSAGHRAPWKLRP